jgi:hypothetical protein
VAPATVSAGWLWEMRSAIVARVRNRNPMEVADDLGHRLWRLLPYSRLLAANISNLFSKRGFSENCYSFPVGFLFHEEGSPLPAKIF